MCENKEICKIIFVYEGKRKFKFIKLNKIKSNTYSLIVDGNIHRAHISGTGNCLVHNPIIGFEAVDCFYGSIGYICENTGKI